MKLSPGDLVHVYNRGNNKQQIFFNDSHYRSFLNKADKEIGSVSDILAYCLMPNHFHFLLHVNENSCKPKKVGSLLSTELQNGFRILQSSYANAINKELQRTGSIFQQKTKFKLLSDGGSFNAYQGTYAEVCFNYIHQNPLKAGLVHKLENWNFSSFREYVAYGLNLSCVEGSVEICNKELAFKLFNLKPETLYKISYDAIKPELLDKIF
jgi:putative transposase